MVRPNIGIYILLRERRYKMKCKFDYCIYNNKHICILYELQIDLMALPVTLSAIPKECIRNIKKND